jgi:hypothetical protein
MSLYLAVSTLRDNTSNGVSFSTYVVAHNIN